MRPEYENDDTRVARDLGLCGAFMVSDRRRRSGRHCERLTGHAGAHASQYSVAGRRDRRRAWLWRQDNAIA